MNFNPDCSIRTRMLIGEDNFSRLQEAKILVVGLGGVGGAALEALVRSGCENIRIVDHDVVSASNINRQLIANTDNIGSLKTDLWTERLKQINPALNLEVRPCFLNETNVDDILDGVDYVLDCIDSLQSKTFLIIKAKEKNKCLVSAMGAANKQDPSLLEITDIYKTSYCRLARVLRQNLRKRGIKKLKVVASKEKPSCPYPDENEKKGRGPAPASMIFVPASMGLLCAKALIDEILVASNEVSQ